MLAEVDAVAVHGFPLDWNHWQIDEWPAKLAEIRAGDRAAAVGVGGRRLQLRRRGGAGVRPAAHRRAAARAAPSGSTGTACTICRRPGRPPRGTARRRGRRTTATSTWASCARTARRSARCASSPQLRARAGHLPVDPLRGPAPRRRRPLAASAWASSACAPGLSWADSRPPRRRRLVRSADARAGAVRRDGHLLLHARARRRAPPPHQPPEGPARSSPISARA